MRWLLLFLIPALAGCLSSPDYVEEYVPPPLKRAEYSGAWPELAQAVIRPGVQVVAEGGQCTANFLFRSADNATLYLGLAAHCLGSAEDPLGVGTPVAIAGINNAGKVAYNHWEYEPSELNDFALIEISNSPSIRAKVHPAVMFFGGPTAMAKGSATTTGAHVLTYGHSGQRPDSDPENPREGYVLHHEEGQYLVWTDHPGIQGDSGSGLMTATGGALGVLSRGTTNPAPGTLANRDAPSLNFYVELDDLVADARRLADLEVQLVTWPLLQGGDLPLAGSAPPLLDERIG